MTPLKWLGVFTVTFLLFGVYGIAAVAVGLYIRHRWETR